MAPTTDSMRAHSATTHGATAQNPNRVDEGLRIVQLQQNIKIDIEDGEQEEIFYRDRLEIHEVKIDATAKKLVQAKAAAEKHRLEDELSALRTVKYLRAEMLRKELRTLDTRKIALQILNEGDPMTFLKEVVGILGKRVEDKPDGESTTAGEEAEAGGEIWEGELDGAE